MRSWTLARARRTCGNCGLSIVVGQPLQLITRIGVTRVLYRCPACAEGDFDAGQLVTPEALKPRDVAPGPPIARVHEWTAVGELARVLKRTR